jgi:sec-independent protein translocase protein TatA
MNPLLLFNVPGGWELIVILLFVLIFFGAKRIPEMARGLGKGIREFRGTVSDIKDELDSTNEEEKKQEKQD